MNSKEKLSGLRLKVYETVFEADTPAGRTFDIALLICIVSSVIVIILESVEPLREQYGFWFRITEWCFTLIFTLEYLARLWTVLNKKKYVLSFFGIVDLLSILPTYLALIFASAHSLMVIRSIRLLRIFRILKLPRYVGEGQNLIRALKASQHKIIVFLFTVLTSVIITGTVMFIIEGPEHGFTSIPRSIYWAIVTMTTVGYGDIAPQTSLGQTVASFIMILGYGIIAVPTGIVSAEMIQLKNTEKISGQVCPNCFREGHDVDATYCKFCGHLLN
ncbi:ion transporter [Chryseosolibacter indicus]|uniref:Ion transporter n=1 Tax=Chryseosolibacter indicus TaxID=2782351 RepID=A0ABS5VJQ0_9BACT|nr:ion transporter [Chryseosolibacter indicus]